MPCVHFSLYSIMPLILFLALVAQLISPTISTSRHTVDHSNAKIGFQVILRRVYSRGNFTKFELLQRAMRRGRKRLERIHAMTHAGSDVSNNIVSPIHAGDGDFLMDLSIGTPPVAFSAILDTGSDLIWTQCKPCKHCFRQPTPIFNPKKSSSYSKVKCSSEFCKALPISICSNDNYCVYGYSYGDGSSTVGVMATETFTFEEVSVPKVGFGCGFNNEGDFDGAGLVGLGRGELSLVSQLDEPKFSYCLTSFGSDETSILSIGSRAYNILGDMKLKTTPLIINPYIPSFYYLSLQGITIGETLLPIKSSIFALRDDGSGGMIIDSGTTLTILVKSAFDVVKKEFTRQMKLVRFGRTRPYEDLEVCFDLSSHAQSLELVPKFIFHFEGTDLELPKENYFITDDRNKVGCLAMTSTNDTEMSIFGNIAQQNTFVVYDLAKETLSFVLTQCHQF